MGHYVLASSKVENLEGVIISRWTLQANFEEIPGDKGPIPDSLERAEVQRQPCPCAAGMRTPMAWCLIQGMGLCILKGTLPRNRVT